MLKKERRKKNIRRGENIQKMREGKDPSTDFGNGHKAQNNTQRPKGDG